MFNIWHRGGINGTVHMLLTWLLSGAPDAARAWQSSGMESWVVPTAMSTCVVWAENGRFRGVQWNVSCLNSRFPQNFTTSFELLKEAQHAIVTLHVFCVLPCLKQKKGCSVTVRIDVRREHKKPLIFKMEYETEDCVLSSFYKNDTKWILCFFLVFTTKSIHPDSGLFWKPSSALWIWTDPEDVDFTRSMVGGLEEAGRAASNTAQGVKRPKIVKPEYKRCYLLPSKTGKQREKNPAKLMVAKRFSPFLLKFVPFGRGATSSSSSRVKAAWTKA